MTGYLEGLAADNASGLAANTVAERWMTQYWQHSEGLDVVRMRRAPASDTACSTDRMEQIGTMLLCAKAAEVMRGEAAGRDRVPLDGTVRDVA